MSQIKKVMSIFIACAMILAAAAFAVSAGDSAVVYLTVENTTFSADDGAAWEGKLLDNVAVEITEGESRIVDVIVSGIETAGYSQTGAEYGYVSDVNGLGEFSASMSGGWMITLNDWFTSAGVGEFYVSDGDCISLMYTTEGFGEDLGGTWSNNNKQLKDISFSTGELSAEFSAGTYEYILTVPSGTDSVKITPTAANKNFQTRIYLNTEFSDGETGKYIDGEEEYESVLCGLAPWTDIPENIGFYKRTQDIPVQEGDVIAVACGLPYWSSMNSGEYGNGAENEPGTVYLFTVETAKEEITVDAGIYDYTAVTYKENNSESEVAASENGIVYEAEDFPVEEGTTVLDAIKAILDNAQLDYTLGANDSYVTSVGFLSELDCGAQSGWMISVNDEFLTVSAAEAILEEGDTIKLHYSVEGWGTDVGSYFTGGPVVLSLTVGGVETIISSNTVYADENDWTGTTTYYLGTYLENGENTPLEGNGSIETPFVIPLTVAASVDVTALAATVQTSLHENYLVISEGEGLNNILSSVNYENDVTFGIETLGGFKKNYYTIKVTKEASSDENDSDDSSSDADSSDNGSSNDNTSNTAPSRPSSSGRGGSSKKDTEEAVNEETNEDVKEETKPTVSFNDIKGHWAEEYIERLAGKGVINGKSEGNFAPEDKITRAELVTLLYRLSGMEQETITDKFIDIDESDWYAQAISWAEENQVANGMTEKEFRPDEFVNREQSAVLIIRFCELMKYEFAEGEEREFTDASELSDWSGAYISKAQKYGIIGGFEDGSFKPAESLTRAQTAKMLCSMLENQIVRD